MFTVRDNNKTQRQSSHRNYISPFTMTILCMYVVVTRTDPGAVGERREAGGMIDYERNLCDAPVSNLSRRSDDSED